MIPQLSPEILAKRIEFWPLEKLRPYARNPRTHSDEQITSIMNSIRRFGFTNPILVDTADGIIAGHGRLRAAQKLGMSEVPVIVLSGLTDDERRAYIIADNRLALDAGWHPEFLPEEMAALKAVDFDLSIIGFTPEELTAIFMDRTEPQSEEDNVPEPMGNPVTQPGDLWILGDHRLLCGDAARRQDVDRLVEGGRVDLVNSDPPYNVRVEPRSNNAIAAGVSSFANLQHHQSLDVHRHPSKSKATTKKMRPKDRALANDFVKDAEYDLLLRQWFGNLAGVLKPGGSFYIWGGYANCANYPPGARGMRILFSPGDHLGEGTPRADPQGFYGEPRVVFLLARRRGPLVQPGDQERDGRVERQENQPERDGPSD